MSAPENSEPIAAFDATQSEAFAGHLLSTINGGALCLMIAIGHRTGLFDVMAGLPASTSSEIAHKAGLNERYVREWLGAMATGGVVEVDATSTCYKLPPEHGAFLTRAAGVNNLALLTQYISVLGSVEEGIIACFKTGGGVPYEQFPRFHEVMAEDSGQFVLSTLDSHILPLVPGVRERLSEGIRMLDIGCGSGRMINQLAAWFPNSRFTGLDLSSQAIENARREARQKGLQNTEFLVRDLSDFDENAEIAGFDFVTTFDAIHDQAKPLNVLRGIHRTLKADGVYLMQEISGTGHVYHDRGHPLGPLLYTISTMHCMTVSLAQGGEGLGAMWGEVKTRDYLRQAGFGEIEAHQLTHDISNIWYVVRK